MTDYEKLSLALLAAIAQGISVQLSQATVTTPETRLQLAEAVMAWQQRLSKLLEQVIAATEDEK
jgi:hypothetical protein